MKRLTVDEVAKLWQCRRIVILRLMKNRTLPWFEGEDGEPLFDEDWVLKIKDPHTAGPHLRIVRPVQAVKPGPSLEELAQRRARISEELRELNQQTAALRAESTLLIEHSREVERESIETRRWGWRERGRGRALRTKGIAVTKGTSSVVQLTKQSQKIEEIAQVTNESDRELGAGSESRDRDQADRRTKPNNP